MPAMLTKYTKRHLNTSSDPDPVKQAERNLQYQRDEVHDAFYDMEFKEQLLQLTEMLLDHPKRRAVCAWLIAQYATDEQVAGLHDEFVVNEEPNDSH